MWRFTSIRDRVPAVKGAAAFMRNATSVVINGEQREVQSMTISEEYSMCLARRRCSAPAFTTVMIGVTAMTPAVAELLVLAIEPVGRSRRDRPPHQPLAGLEYSVAGVMPQGFSGHSPIETDIWVTFGGAMRNNPGWDRDSQRNFTAVVVRLGDDQNPAAAATQAGAVIDRQVVLQPVTGTEIASTEKRIAWWLAAVSIVVFLIGLANAATLLSVRGARLRHDVAIRAALGASRSRSVQHAVIEAVVLAALATIAS